MHAEDTPGVGQRTGAAYARLPARNYGGADYVEQSA